MRHHAGPSVCMTVLQVAVEWRDAYTLTCLLRADMLLQASTGNTAANSAAIRQHDTGALGEISVCICTEMMCGTTVGSCSTNLLLAVGSKGTATTSAAEGVASGQPAEGTASQEGLQEALKHLDMAALMGGPALRPALDAAIACVQRKMQAISSVPAADSASAHTAAVSAINRCDCTRDAELSTEAQPEEPAAKRPRTEREAVAGESLPGAGTYGSSGRSSAEGQPAAPAHHHVDSDVANVAAEVVEDAARIAIEDAWPSGDPFTAAPPPGSLCGEPIPMVELPSLERHASRPHFVSADGSLASPGLREANMATSNQEC